MSRVEPGDVRAPDERDAISRLLEFRPRGPGVRSNLAAVLADARGVTGRDQETGDVIPERAEHSALWLGALGYLIAIEIIGKYLDRVGYVGDEKRPIMRALLQFTEDEVEDEDAHKVARYAALYALRNAFAHNYSLFNERAGLSHRFALTTTGEAPVVRLPAEGWDGTSFGPARPEEVTWVDLRALGDMAERVYRNVCEAHRQGQVTIAKGRSISELYTVPSLFEGVG